MIYVYKHTLYALHICVYISSVQSLSRVRLFATPLIAARQASLPITNSQSSLRLTSIESVMPSSHLILCRPLLFLFVHGVLKARILKWFAILFSSGPHSVRTLHHDPLFLDGLTRHGLISLSWTRLWSMNGSVIKRKLKIPWLICIYWTILLNLGWILLGYGVWFFFYVLLGSVW